MRFLVKQKVFSFGDNFVIKDDRDNHRFIVKGKVFALGDKLRIYDLEGQELFYIEQKLLRLLPEYTIYKSGQAVATVKKDFTFFRPRFSIWSIYGNYTIQGNLLGMDFSINKDGKTVAQVSKRWLSFGDTYSVDISDDEDYAFILTLVIVIDQVLHDDNHNNS